MMRFDFDGQSLEISELDFFALLERVLYGEYESARLRHDDHVTGLLDITGSLSPFLQKGHEQFQALIPEIPDEKLSSLCQQLELLNEEMMEINRRCLSIVASFFNSPAPETPQARRKLNRKINKYLLVTAPGPGTKLSEYHQLRPWIKQPGYQQLLERSQQTLNKITETKQQVTQRLVELLSDKSSLGQNHRQYQTIKEEPVHPDNWLSVQGSHSLQITEFEDIIEFGDQRAKDLIDEADGKLDPREAIKLLLKALRYGDSGIQASKAFLELGIRYQELGNKTKAIKYYSKAIEAGNPSAIMFFWRGQLNFQLQKWDEAKADFERSLSFKSEGRLPPPEHSEALNYLLHLSNRANGN